MKISISGLEFFVGSTLLNIFLLFFNPVNNLGIWKGFWKMSKNSHVANWVKIVNFLLISYLWTIF